MGWVTKELGLNSQHRHETLSLQSVHVSSEAHSASCLVDTIESFPKGKVARHAADHSVPPIAEVKNEWLYTSTPQHSSAACTGSNLPLL
jgi:hypothetical protein